MDTSVFSLGSRAVGLPSGKREEISFLRDILRQCGRQWKEDVLKISDDFTSTEEGSLHFQEEGEEIRKTPQLQMILPFREVESLEKHGKAINFPFTTYAVEDDRADFTARNVAVLPGENMQQGIRFELMGLWIIGRISARGLSEKQVEPLLGAASCLLAMGFSMAEVLDLINRRPWGK